jgi:hypothetical protein
VNKSHLSNGGQKASVFSDTVTLLKSLVSAESLESAQEAVSAGLAESIREAFLRSRGLKLVSDPCLHKVAGKPCPRDPTVTSGSRKIACRPIWADHDDMFANDRQHVFVAQPYQLHLGIFVTWSEHVTNSAWMLI